MYIGDRATFTGYKVVYIAVALSTMILKAQWLSDLATLGQAGAANSSVPAQPSGLEQRIRTLQRNKAASGGRFERPTAELRSWLSIDLGRSL